MKELLEQMQETLDANNALVGKVDSLVESKELKKEARGLGEGINR